MTRINLLPHRAEKRKQRRTQFYLLSTAMLVLGALIGFLVHSIYAGYIEQQESRNAFLKTEIGKLDQQIAEIRRLGEQIDASMLAGGAMAMAGTVVMNWGRRTPRVPAAAVAAR